MGFEFGSEKKKKWAICAKSCYLPTFLLFEIMSIISRIINRELSYHVKSYSAEVIMEDVMRFLGNE